MPASTLDFARLKQRVSLAQVLTAKGLTGALKQRGSRLIGPCPVHGGDNPRAFVADLGNNLWHCFTRCQGGGDVVELVRRLDHLSYRETARYLARLAQEPLAVDGPRAADGPGPFRPFIRRLALDPATPWLAHKGISPATAARFEAGAYHGCGFLEACIGVRLHDPDGQPLGYAGRRLDTQTIARSGKWKLPRGLPKRHLLYGVHRAVAGRHHGIAVVECPWGVMRLAQLGVPAVALLGTQLSPAQHQLLRQYPRVVLMLDGDPAGRTATVTLLQRLGQSVHTQCVYLPTGYDPDDLDDSPLAALVRPLLL
jgi:DNA primase